MSVSLILFPVTLAIALTIREAASVLIEKAAENREITFETVFNDVHLLQKTLSEHGLIVNVISENELVCSVDNIQLSYLRQDVARPFMLNVTGVNNINEVLSELECFENEYQRNVQTFTYNRLLENAEAHKMRVSNEVVLEDNSIMLTLDI